MLTPSNCGASKTVRRILVACVISLFSLMGNISLDLSKTLELWQNAEKALASVPLCPDLLTLHLVGLLQGEGQQHCCWKASVGEDDGQENTSLPEHALEILAALCKKSGENIHSMDPQCREGENVECKRIISKVKERLRTTETADPALTRLTIISELLEMFPSLEEDLKAAQSNPDWVVVASLRSILRVKGAILKSQEMLPTSEDFRSLWRQLSANLVLAFSVFASESVHECWTENPNLSASFSQYDSQPLFSPLPFLASKKLVKDLDSLQACLSDKSHEKLGKKAREILSLVSLKVSLLAVACLIYPIVLVSFREMTEWIQNYARSLKDRTEDLKRERLLAEDLLHQMLPRSVAKQLRKHKHVKAENFDQVTIFFSDIVGFTSIAACCSPLEVVEMLNNLYICFDTRIDSYDVYKVETIGDAYMVVSGLPERNGTKHADEIAKMSLDLVAAVRQVVIPHVPTEKLQLRAGVHTGPCVAGVVGHKMPRYCLFGDTVNTASRMESTSLPQKIHISLDTYHALLADGAYDIMPRGEIEVKGKGKMKTYWLLGNKNYSIQNDSLVCHWNPEISGKKKAGTSCISIQQSSTGTMGNGTLEDEKTSTTSSQKKTSFICHASPTLCVPGADASGTGQEPGFQESLKTNPLHPSGSPKPGQGGRGPDILEHRQYHRPECQRASPEKGGQRLPGFVSEA